MHQLLNTLYVLTQRAFVHLDHETLKIKVNDELKLQVPLHHLGAIICFGDVQTSTALLHRCAENGRAVVFMDYNGRFKARLEGPLSGNVLLRRAQHEAFGDPARVAGIARSIVAGKLHNSRQVLLRGARETPASEDAGPLQDAQQEADGTWSNIGPASKDAGPLQDAARHIADMVPRLEPLSELDRLRGLEGDAARAYFAVFDHMVKGDRSFFAFNERSRRPPRDPINALLSFLYALLLSDCVAAAAGVGLDPQVGYLHALRPGRPALGLDLMEELRPVLADRLALTLINRQQVASNNFESRPGGAVLLNEVGRKTVVTAYQQRKQDEVLHPVLDQKMPLGLVPHVQARLLARHLRGDLDQYPPFPYR